MKFCINFRRKTSSSVHHPMAMAKPAYLSSDDDLTDSFKSLTMHKEPGASTQSTEPTQSGTQTTIPTQTATQSTPAIPNSTQITIPTQPSPPTANSTQPPPQTTTPTQSSPTTANSTQPPPQQPVQQPMLSSLPTFPAPEPPICGKCHNTCTRRIVSASNRNNNANRPFYICKVCKEDPNIPGRSTEKGWISWDDSVGVVDTNKACYCGVACRQDRAGWESRYRGNGFWTCAYGMCDFLSYRRDFLTVKEVMDLRLDLFDGIFVPWLL